MTLDAAPSLPLRALGYTRSETLPALHGMHAFAATPARRLAQSHSRSAAGWHAWHVPVHDAARACRTRRSNERLSSRTRQAKLMVNWPKLGRLAKPSLTSSR